MLLHTLRYAEPGDRDRAVQLLSRRRPSADGELGLTALLDGLVVRGELSRPGLSEITARLQGHRPTESKNLDDIRWLYGLMLRIGSMEHAREVARWHARKAALLLAGLDWFPASRHRDVLCDLVDYVHRRAR
jgi:geranylgeranyl diphosphate synthase type II